MANIKDLKVRIKSTSSTLKITSAMKLVSAAKLSKAQAKIQGFKPYSSELDSTVRVASALATDYSHDYLKENDSKKSALLVISSDKGLCGGYNSQLFKKVKTFISENKDTEIETFFIGRKVRELMKKEGFNVGEIFTFEGKNPTFGEVRNIALELSKKFLNSDFGNLTVAYNSFISVIEYDPSLKQVLPMTETNKEEDNQETIATDFKYEPSAEKILDTLIPEVFNTTVYTCILDAIAAEHATRMTAMDNATKNSKDMIKTLTLKANKLRQAAITTELTEIVSGAESLNS